MKGMNLRALIVTVPFLFTMASPSQAAAPYEFDETKIIQMLLDDQDSAASLSDAQVAGVMFVANTSEVLMSSLAMARSQNADVKAYAQKLIRDHSKSNQDAFALSLKLRMLPAGSKLAGSLWKQSQETMRNLAGLSGMEFDRAFMAATVVMHRSVLDSMEMSLMPSADNSELRSLLERDQPIIAGHLEEANRLVEMLGTASEPGS